MRIPSSSRAARGCAAATLIFSLGLTPSFAGMGGAPSVRPAFGGGHFSHFAPRGFNRRFDFDRFGANGFGRFGFDRFNRFGGNQLLVGGWGAGVGAAGAASRLRLGPLSR
jgi:hypothetical protein